MVRQKQAARKTTAPTLTKLSAVVVKKAKLTSAQLLADAEKRKAHKRMRKPGNEKELAAHLKAIRRKAERGTRALNALGSAPKKTKETKEKATKKKQKKKKKKDTADTDKKEAE
jgi:hypothetical protein